ncbi:MAG: hypothetical protein IPF40_14985 [Actinomycetales bacterium]|uniref:Uncharacterized protein n=1 Tax=Candidatus Phosphoribacter hodrii TaxID=2953743 RepID=A0A935CGL7_9MICO|nr:hypothetical protein [Candidatus Phosphoribacter hodrii]
MQHVGPGTLIGDRYAVSHRLQQHPRWERWAAHDTTLGRDVVILTFAGAPQPPQPLSMRPGGPPR